MSIADDIKKVMRVHSFECLSDSEIAELAGDLAPRLAHFAQQVMPLVEAAERYQDAHGGMFVKRYQDAKYALLAAALALNLGVPR